MYQSCAFCIATPPVSAVKVWGLRAESKMIARSLLVDPEAAAATTATPADTAAAVTDATPASG